MGSANKPPALAISKKKLFELLFFAFFTHGQPYGFIVYSMPGHVPLATNYF
jgi:hypothetical protein